MAWHFSIPKCQTEDDQGRASTASAMRTRKTKLKRIGDIRAESGVVALGSEHLRSTCACVLTIVTRLTLCQLLLLPPCVAEFLCWLESFELAWCLATCTELVRSVPLIKRLSYSSSPGDFGTTASWSHDTGIRFAA